VEKYPLPAEEMRAREDNLRKIADARDRSRPQAIDELLRETLTQERIIHPSFGQLIFWEIIFTNPYPKRHVFAIHIVDPAIERRTSATHEINLVTDLKEWLFYKQAYGANTPTQHVMFNQDRVHATISSAVPSSSSTTTTIVNGDGVATSTTTTMSTPVVTESKADATVPKLESPTMRVIQETTFTQCSLFVL
jgi:hypothetical protein